MSSDGVAPPDPERDYHEIYRGLVTREFPWDMYQALSFALYRTYAVPSIGRLLFETGELTGRVQKRYDDTVLILDAILEHGMSAGTGRDAVRRMNQMHSAYDISNDEMRYVLATFVVVPMRWLDDFGWRRLTETERVATAHYYRALGRHMGISGIPSTHTEFADYLDSYEREHFAFDPGARAVADATLELMTTFPPNHLAPKAVVRRLALSMMDDPLLTAMHYPQPTRAERAAVHAALRLRSRLVRHLPARRKPLYPRQRSSIRSYPGGYDVPRLGTFPRPCPVTHDTPSAGPRSLET